MSKHKKTSSKWTLFSNMRFIAMFNATVCVLFLIKLRWPKEGSISNHTHKTESWHFLRVLSHSPSSTVLPRAICYCVLAKRGQDCIRVKWFIRPELITVAAAWSAKEYFYSALDRMIVHAGLAQASNFPDTYFYTWVERGIVRVTCLGREHNTMYLANVSPSIKFKFN